MRGRRWWYELSIHPLALATLVLGWLLALWIQPAVLYALGASGFLAARFLEVASFVLGSMLGAQLLTPELRGQTLELLASRRPGLVGLLLLRLELVLIAWTIVSWWMGTLLLWSDPGRGAGVLALSFGVSGFVGLALAAAGLLRTGSPTTAMAASSLVLGSFLALAAAGWDLGPLELFPVYAFYPDSQVLRAKAFWLLTGIALVAYALYRAHRPVGLWRSMDRG